MTQITEKQILQALSQVEDPDLKRDIVSLGFIKNLNIQTGAVSFDVELTTPACPVKEQLKQQCIDVVNALGVDQVNVNMTAQVRSAPTGIDRKVPGVRNILAVASGKGGVGKSTLAVNLALSLLQSGARVGLLDCDFYGPSVPSMVGAHSRVLGDAENRIIPHQAHGMPVLSMGHLVDQGQPIAWRGPMLQKMINQFLYGAKWGELDYLILDLPPGTGDVQMSLAQYAPMAGAVLVTTPQEVALRDVEKGLEMFRTMKVPVLGVIENMSYYICGSCDKKHYIFGKGGGKRMAEEFQLPLLGEIPLDVRIPSPMGEGKPVVISDRDSKLASTYREVAGKVVAELSRISGDWAQPGPGAMEV